MPERPEGPLSPIGPWLPLIGKPGAPLSPGGPIMYTEKIFCVDLCGQIILSYSFAYPPNNKQISL